VANVPVVLDVAPPPDLFKLPRGKVAALTITPERLAGLRKVRADSMGGRVKGYADIEHIRREVAYAYSLFERRRHWALIDVTAKPIEEAAAEIITLLRPSIQ